MGLRPSRVRIPPPPLITKTIRALAATAALAITALAPGLALAAQTPPKLTLAKQVGQLVIASYQRATPPASLLGAIRAGHVGAVILMGANTKRGVSATRAAVNTLQQAARAGGNPGLLVMTDQEGGEVKRLPARPTTPPRGWAAPPPPARRAPRPAGC